MHAHTESADSKTHARGVWTHLRHRRASCVQRSQKQTSAYKLTRWWCIFKDTEATCYQTEMFTLWLLEVCTHINTYRRGSCLYVCMWHAATEKLHTEWVFFCVHIVLTRTLWTSLHKKTRLTLWGLWRFTAAVFTDKLCRHRQEHWSPLIVLQARKHSTFESECRTVIGCMNLLEQVTELLHYLFFIFLKSLKSKFKLFISVQL